MAELVVEAEELIEVANRLEGVLNSLTEASYINGMKMKNNEFYKSGMASELFDKIVSKNGRIIENMTLEEGFALGVAGDFYGKVQMLGQYYSILSEYCMQVMMEFKDKDEKIAQYIEQKTNEMMSMGGG